MRLLIASFAGAAFSLAALSASPAAAAVINVSPADGNMAYTKIEAAGPGDEVIIAPGTYAFRVYLQGQGTASQPIHIHGADPANPPVWDPGMSRVDDLPGSYTAGDKARGCWQVSGGTGYLIEDIVLQNCHAADNDSAGLRYYNGTMGLTLRSVLFKDNDNGLTGGTEGSDATVEFSEFSGNGNLAASSGSPTHNAYIYGGTFAVRYSYFHDPLQAQNLHCRAVTSTIEYNWFDRAKSYVGDLMTSDDYASNPVGSLTQTMTLRGNVIIQTASQANDSQIWAIYNDEASGSPVSFSVTALYNTVVGAGGHAAFLHVSNADGTQMTASVSDNLIAGTSQPILVEDSGHADVSGTHNWIQTGADGTGLSGTITGASPGFNAPAGDDFTLAAGSACIGAADATVTGLPTDEYYQNETVTRLYRVRAAAKDVGAFEHDTTGPGIGPGGAPVGSPDGGAPDAGPGTGGSSTGSSSSSSGSAGSGGATGGAGAAGAPGKSSGCSCHTAGATGTPAMLWALALVGFAGLRRRRRS
jgi:MYXO-CTERM domain-containing protein